MRATRLLATVALPALLAASAACAAQPAFPDKAIRLIIGSASGSGPDIMARLIADHLYGVWGQRVVVDTRPGVAGILSAEQALRANPDAIANEIQMQFAVYPAAFPHVSSGRLRGLGVSTANRAPGLPNLPTIVETVPGYVNFGWYSIVAPKGTPAAVLAKASAEIVKAAREPAFGERLKTLGIEIIAGGRKELDDYRAAERKRLTELVKATGISIAK